MFQTSSIGLILRKPPQATFKPVAGFEFRPVGAGANVGQSAPGQAGANPTVYNPDHWDLDAGTYTLQEGDTLAQLAFFAGVQCPPAIGGGKCGPNDNSYVHNINVLNSDVYSDPNQVAAGTVIKMPAQGIKNIIALGCPDGYQKAPTGQNCVSKTPPPNPNNPPAKPPANMIGGNFGIWALVAAVVLGGGILIAENQKKKRAAPAHHHAAYHR